MKITRKIPLQGIVNSYIIDSPAPNNISYFWNFGSLQGVNLVVLIISGITLAMHYTPNTALAFNSVEHIQIQQCVLKNSIYAENNKNISTFLLEVIMEYKSFLFNIYDLNNQQETSINLLQILPIISNH